MSMAEFYSDEDFPFKAVLHLRRLGHHRVRRSNLAAAKCNTVRTAPHASELPRKTSKIVGMPQKGYQAVSYREKQPSKFICIFCKNGSEQHVAQRVKQPKEHRAR